MLVDSLFLEAIEIMSRPAEDLSRLMHNQPNLPQFVNDIYKEKMQGELDWPSWCFIPVSIWSKLAERAFDSSAQMDLRSLSSFLSFVPSVGTWRYSQGVYRFDAELLAALKDTPVTGDLPADVLLRLPEWAIFVETPGFTFYGHETEGFYASLDWNMQHQVPELRLMFAVPPARFQTLAIVLDDTPLEDILTGMVQHIDLAQDIIKDHPELTPPERESAINKKFVEELSSYLSLLLFICSDEPEIDDLRVPGSSPKYASARKTKRGWRFFPAEKERIWNIGQKIGEKLRQHVKEDDGTVHEATGRTVRTHLRRGHWHGVWTGPRKGKGEQKFKLNWLPPIIVAAK